MSESRPWHILHLDLASGVPSLEPAAETAGLFVVLWWGDVPLGHVELPAARLPLPAGAVRSLVLDAVLPAVSDRLFERGFRAEPSEYEPSPTSLSVGTLSHMETPFAEAVARVAEIEAAAPSASTAVIICTRERPDALRACLASLAALSPGPDELIVVDNAPTTDATRRAVDDSRGEGVPVRYVLEPRPGLSVARNAGPASQHSRDHRLH